MSIILESYGFLAGKVVQLLELDFIDKLKTYEINARQYGVLIKVNEMPNSSQKEIAEELKIDRTTMVDHVDHLESLKYIARVKNPEDRRSYCLSITEKGKQTLDKCWEILQQSEQNVLAALDNEEKALFKRYLKKILKGVV
ncbi:MarR family transcriptional regulator [Bacillus canaveralius]|uniref:MarR family transcriptional regulator n=1 Tax=Bacillus canaveralius TaxID=1403243 RepID=A0A2N5GPA6_9BACI|nr:MarR family transcriptional regulator [Bacillus canaveralius]PLR87005.1 MarR family transcriptional regulator [Bacillus sp. V33-4]PLS00588.1 MarR family transcriptional regulator [Bacillus canaveralius]RSK57873.1 MarR family transcriptional regulator [Bacillus canaveralius]